MSSDNDVENPEKRNKRLLKVGRICNGGLETAAIRAGMLLCGMSIRLDEYECLITLRLEILGERRIAFVGGGNMASALGKAYTQLNSGTLKTREDRWGPKQAGQE